MPQTFHPSGAVRAAGAATLLALCTACGGGSKPEPPAAPNITAQPASLTVGAGSAATFSVSAGGSAPLSYQWKRNGADIEGATGPSHTLAATQLADTRSTWSVTVRNAAGTVVSAQAALHVTGLAVWAGKVDEEGLADGAAAEARFTRPYGLAFDKEGKLLVGDSANKALRSITSAGQVGTLPVAFKYGPSGLTVDAAGNIYVLDHQNVMRVSAAGASTVLAVVPYCDGRGGSICSPFGIAVDAADNVYVASGATTRKIAPDGSYLLLEGSDGGYYPSTGAPHHSALAFDGKSAVYELDTAIRKIDSAGKYANVADGLPGFIGGAAFDAAGNLYFTAMYDSTVRKMTPAGVITTVAGVSGQNGLASGALPGGLHYPRGIAIDRHGDLYVVSGHAIVKIQLPPQ